MTFHTHSFVELMFVPKLTLKNKKKQCVLAEQIFFERRDSMQRFAFFFRFTTFKGCSHGPNTNTLVYFDETNRLKMQELLPFPWCK